MAILRAVPFAVKMLEVELVVIDKHVIFFETPFLELLQLKVRGRATKPTVQGVVHSRKKACMSSLLPEEELNVLLCLEEMIILRHFCFEMDHFCFEIDHFHSESTRKACF
mmetsp:Transcript_12958/g.13070  ORF Transcript_12958/g.13070 Transcript_12958/m.13070 type:complete len:110 (+) Transcript_12958:107-436(+)